MKSIDEDGFLGQEVEHWINKHRHENKGWFDLCEELNRFCQKLLPQLKVHTDNGREIVSTVLFTRILSHFQGIIILSERGMIKEAEVVLRAMLEAIFALCAIANDEDLVRDFVLNDERQRLNIFKKMRELKEKSPEFSEFFLDGMAKEDINQMIDDIENKIKDENIPVITTKYLAEKANLLNHYLVVYPLLSSTAHVRIRDLEYHLDEDEEGDISRFSWGPDVTGIEKILFQAAEFGVFSVMALNEIFDLKIKSEVDDFVTRYQRMGKENGSIN